MKLLRRILDKQARHFEPGGRFERFYPLYEAPDTFLYTPGKTTTGAAHVRDALDLKRLMMTVVVALVPCVLMAMWNTGRQIHVAVAGGAAPLANWRTDAMEMLGLSFDASSLLANTVHGALYYVPVLVVTFAVGGAWEGLFAVVRRHDVNEGFLVTGMLFPLVLPPTIPLWQVAVGISFGVVVGKEIFGGTGYNVLNPALTARVFLFFAYPAQISGDAVWIAAGTSSAPDGYSGATALGEIAVLEPVEGSDAPLDGLSAIEGKVSWMQAFLGDIPGSMGETSALACLIGAAILIATGIGSWRIMVAATAGTAAISLLLNLIASPTNAMLSVPFHWHLVLGGWAFGIVFMATDPVSAAQTNRGRYIYGFLVGVLAVLIRTINPAFPEGVMLGILFMNLFAPLIDHYVLKANIKRRQARYAQ
ncbi:MAG: NADH:ubiquinone reductase (Na(+)-transporting) subunit B [Holophagales bacterium]|nr:NADH:ubiquinone reductase (Na(+)-transporting) subunit B [Holophagales bacterium]MYA09651.1 NADH:ubiquinone reductase (Na(+)-transporting) subunit B [Holophagales bacterium]MYD20655.1 NADH:ubiquinone reductase (Na(+)-transporting) subunit B [Holophagales bacterium]MYG30560.1 NADH:ubiquinone reductase (Na(+)-transporting) subunit B [Holophagales bacterium]MYI33935.1 NADH:ubiquinone reductase (Na(+)-transporting) subunit B [Holophagales bacterium]